MNFASLLTSGALPGLLAFAGAISTAAGKPALGAVLADPTTAQTVTITASGILALLGGFMRGIRS